MISSSNRHKLEYKMVVTAFLTPSWTVPIISVSILCVAVVFLLCCFCIQKRRTETLNFGTPTHRNFLDISNTSLNKLMIFRNCDSDKGVSKSLHTTGSESDLLENEDLSKRFNSSRLKIDDVDDLDHDVRSCGSTDSRFTFYSTYPVLARSQSTLSDTATYKSMKNSMKSITISCHTSSSSMFVA